MILITIGAVPIPGFKTVMEHKPPKIKLKTHQVAFFIIFKGNVQLNVSNNMAMYQTNNNESHRQSISPIRYANNSNNNINNNTYNNTNDRVSSSPLRLPL